MTLVKLNSLFSNMMQAWDDTQGNPMDAGLFALANKKQGEWEEGLRKFKVENEDDADKIFIDVINRTVSILNADMNE